MNLKILQQEMLKAMRGSRSQMQLSRRMKYGHNQIYRWESGSARLHWREFARLCRALKVDLAHALDSALRYTGDAEDGAALVGHLMQGRRINEFAATHGVSRFKLQRWLHGTSDVPLDMILAALEGTQSLLAFARLLAPPEEIPSLASLAARQNHINGLLLKYPMTGAVFMMLLTSDYRRLPVHKSGWIARQLGISQQEEEEILKEAEAAGIVGRESGKFAPKQERINTIDLPEGQLKMREYWVQRGLAFDARRALLPSSKRGYFGNAVLALGAEQERRLQDLLVQMSNQINAIVSEPAAGKTKISVLNLQFFNP